MRKDLFLLLISFLLFSCRSREKQVFYEEMVGFPDKELGIEQGVSACFAGILDGYLLMAGGCNFPDVPAADGGTKKYYKGIYAAKLTAENVLDWKLVGELPSEVAYGVTISLYDRLLMIGGNNSAESFKTAYSVAWTDDLHTTIQIDSLQSLPFPLDNMTGCLVGRYIYLAGGNKDGKPCNDVLRLSLDDMAKGWESLPSFPGQARIQSVCGGIDGVFYMWGGFDLSAKTLNTDGFCFDEAHRHWISVQGPEDIQHRPLFTGGGIAIARDSQQVIVIGGVNKDIFMTGMLQTDSLYMRHPISWYQFNPYVLQFDGKRWKVLSHSQGITARAGAALVNGDGVFYMVGGELKPGIRSNKIYRFDIQE